MTSAIHVAVCRIVKECMAYLQARRARAMRTSEALAAARGLNKFGPGDGGKGCSTQVRDAPTPAEEKELRHASLSRREGAGRYRCGCGGRRHPCGRADARAVLCRQEHR